MIFKKLELTNFKSHQHSVINFNSGITLIIGENGAGKSTIFEAISFALYKKYVGDKIDDLVRTVPSAKTMSVTLTFISNGIEYKITRKRTANQSKAKLEKLESQYITIAETDKIVTQQIQEILDMDADLFLNAIYIRQGEIANLISKSPAEKKQLIGKLLKLEELEKASKNSLPLINDYRWKQAESKGKLLDIPFNQVLRDTLIEYRQNKTFYEQTEKTKKNLIEKQKENKIQKNEIEKLKKEYDELNIKLSNENDNLRRLLKEQEEIQFEIENIKSVEDKIQKLKPFVEQLIEYENNNEYLNINKKIKELEDEKFSLNGEIQTLEYLLEEKNKLRQKVLDDKEQFNTINNFLSNVYFEMDKITQEEQINSFEDKLSYEINIYKEELRDNMEEIDKLNGQVLQLDAENKSYMDLLTQTEQLDQQCPVCKSPINEDKKFELVKHYNEIIQFNEKSITELNYKIDEIAKINVKFTAQMEDLENIKKQLPSYRWLHDNITTNISTLQKMNERLLYLDTKRETLTNIEHQINLNKAKIEDRSSKIKSLQKQNQEYNQLLGSIQNKDKILAKHNKIYEEIITQKDVINNLTERIHSSKYDAQEYDKLQQAEEKINSDIMSATISLKESEIKLIEIKKKIQDTIESFKTHNENKEEYDSLGEMIILLEDIRHFYSKDGVQKTLRSLAKPVIKNYTKKFFEEFNFNYSDLMLDDEYNITLYGPEGEVKLDMISGGEKIAVALALRLGITEAISKTNVETILLDEPTIHLDTQRIHELITLLKGLSSLPQMIIVTHDVELENVADNIFKVAKDNGVSKVV